MGASPNSSTLLSVRRLSVPRESPAQLKNINFSLETGEILAVVGSKGAGKSTLLDLLSCVMPVASGRVIYQGRDILSLAPYRLARLGLAVMGERLSLIERGTVLENLMLARHGERRSGLLQHVFFPPWVRREEVYHRQRVEEVIDALGLHSVRQERICDLPFGVQKFTDLGRTLVMRPRLVLGDELTRGLSAEESKAMVRALGQMHRRGISLLLMEEAEGVITEMADRVAHLEAGELRFGADRGGAAS